MSVFRHLPNVLSGLRLAAGPATAGLLVAGHFNVAFGVFAFAGITDALDGFLAKRLGLQTRIGTYLDPAADKALLLTAFVTLYMLAEVPLWVLASVFAREIIIVSGIVLAAIARAPLEIAPLMIGKVFTAFQIIYVGAHLAELAFGVKLDAVEPEASYLLAAIGFVSALSYGYVWFMAMRSRAAARN